jgi:hypothetical protein
MIVTFVTLREQLAPEIPLFYTKPWGEERLGENWNILFIPLLMTVAYVIFSLLRQRWYRNDRVMSRITSWLISVYITISLLAYIRILARAIW